MYPPTEPTLAQEGFRELRALLLQGLRIICYLALPTLFLTLFNVDKYPVALQIVWSMGVLMCLIGTIVVVGFYGLALLLDKLIYGIRYVIYVVRVLHSAWK